MIPYEALEKHELQECQYRLTQCAGCLEEMLQKDLDAHQDEQGESSQSTCLKCDTIYKRCQGHAESQCLEKQMVIIKVKPNAAERKLTRVEDNNNKMVQRHNRQHLNDGFAGRSQLSDDVSDCE